MSVVRVIYKDNNYVPNNMKAVKYCYNLYSLKNDQSESKKKKSPKTVCKKEEGASQ